MNKRVIEGSLDGKGRRVAVVVAKFNRPITELLLEGCLNALERHDVEDADIYWVPGAFELSYVAHKIAKDYDAVICLGVVIRGETPHFDYVCQEAASGIRQVAVTHEKPVIFGVLTTHTLEQALERASVKKGNKGGESACAALELLNSI